jgi:hypothetical protein
VAATIVPEPEPDELGAEEPEPKPMACKIDMSPTLRNVHWARRVFSATLHYAT